MTHRRLLHVTASLLAVFLFTACAGAATPTAAPPAVPDISAAPVSGVEVLRLAGEPLDLRLVVRGTLPDACLRTGTPVVERRARLFEVQLPVSRPEGQNCPPVPFDYEQIVRLPSEAVLPGAYTLLVNGALFTFDVPDPRIMASVTGAEEAVAVNIPNAVDVPTAVPLPDPTAVPEPDPTPTPEVRPTAVVLGGQDPDNCHKAALYAEADVVPGSLYEPGQPFLITWKVQNAGTCAWDDSYALVLVEGNNLGAPGPLPVPPAAPGEVVDISAALLAPIAPGAHQGSWAIAAPNGYTFGVGGSGLYPLTARIVTRAMQPDVLSIDLQCGAERGYAEEKEIYDLINAERAAVGLPPVEWVDEIAHVASGFSFELACYDRITHHGRDGFLFPVRLQRAGLLFETSNEMIYAGNGGPQGAVKWWMQSTIHKPIMLSPRYTKVGIGYVILSRNPYKQRVTVDFIKP